MRGVEIPDQPLAERALRAALAREHPPQQLLLFGPPGTGKREAARRLAWALMDPRGRHRQTGVALDLTEVRASGALIRLEDELDPALAAIASRPTVAERRVLIIEGAERLDERNGAPRILKTLEEPPPLSHIVLVTDRPTDLLPTIRSRCLPVPFRTPGWRAIARRLEERGLTPAEAAARARADGTEALHAGAFAVEMRRLGVELGLGALAGGASPARRVREIQGRIEAAAAGNPSEALVALRAEAEALEGKRGGRTADKRAEDQEKRERRRLVTDGWALALGGAEGLIADALALAVGAPEAVRHRERAEELTKHAAPERRGFLERALEELQLTRGELPLNPDTALAMEALLARVEAARAGRAGALVAAGRLPA